MKLLVTGGRDFFNDRMVDRELRKLLNDGDRHSILIHGGCTGADTLCGEWAHGHGIHTAKVRALWGYHTARDKDGFPVMRRTGNPAGVIRNSVMLLLQPELCLAFPGGLGTANMIRLAEEAGVPVKRVK